MREFTWEEFRRRQKEVLPLPPHKAKLPMLARSIAACSNELTATGTRSNVRPLAPCFLLILKACGYPERIFMGQMIYQVDSFTTRPFAGNPAGVCVLPEERDERWMQDV